MEAIIQIKAALPVNMLFAQWEAELISNIKITATSSGEGTMRKEKIAQKDDIVYIDFEPALLEKPVTIGKIYHIRFVQSLYAKNTDKPIVLHVTSIL